MICFCFLMILGALSHFSSGKFEVYCFTFDSASCLVQQHRYKLKSAYF